MRSWWSQFDLFLHFYLIMVLGAIYFLFNYIEGISYSERAGESVLFRIVWMCLYATLFIKILANARVFIALYARSFLLVTLFVLSVGSLLYNGSQDTAVIKFAMYFSTIAFAGWVVVRCPVDSFTEALFRIGIFVLVFHILFFPVIGSVIDYDPLHRATILGTESYAGVFGHKNLAGSFFGLMATISLVRMLSGGSRWRMISSAVMVLLHLLALAATGGVGPLISVAVAIVFTFGGFLLVSGRRDAAAIYWLVIGFATLALLMTPTNMLYQLIGRTSGLTGRAFLWSVWPYFFWQHPLIGYGFAGFFNGLVSGPATELTRMAPWNTEYSSFENAYLEALIQFGLLGGATFILVACRGIWNAVVFAFAGSSTMRLAPFAVLVFTLVSAFNDSSLLLHNFIGCVLMFWCYFGLQVRVVDTSEALESWASFRFAPGWRA
ncbi:O-antigen ligase family protein [Tardiphaga sp. vice154]|uniref:O-antigen ligase family protein n=1 Tax=Tardiphaga sp. vice154 TaxID=2592814 RepID=UPI001163A2DB|nr:O-antigen ligase family protein [Tardiphaga sp. vice154]QDM22646.1 O-antigen ligase family protein [Tardiphaga sp. vice154]